MRPSSRGRTGREPRAVSTVNGGPPHTKTIAGRIFAATLAGLEAEDWTTQRGRFGHLVESFVVQQLMAQAGWTDPDLQFWHYRDRDFQGGIILYVGASTIRTVDHRIMAVPIAELWTS